MGYTCEARIEEEWEKKREEINQAIIPVTSGEDLNRVGPVVSGKRAETRGLGAAEDQQDKGMEDKREESRRIWDDLVMVTLDG